MLLLVVPCLIALLLPAVQQAGEPARRTQCRNNLKEIGLALHDYHDTYGSFPPAYVADENGRPLYSWRVLILPWMDESPLYNEFDFSQPWDSPTNRKVLEQMPDIFHCPSDPSAPANTTSYVAVYGPDCVFSATTPIRIRDVTDGTSNTIMVGEVTGTAIPWTKPEDVDVTVHPTIGSPGGFSSRHGGGTQFLFGDGSVQFISENIDPQTLRDLFLRNDGHIIREF